MRDLRWSALAIPFAFAACADAGPTTGIDVSFTPGVASGALQGLRITNLEVNLEAVTLTSSVREQSRRFDTKGTYFIDLLNPEDGLALEMKPGQSWDGIVLESPNFLATQSGALLGLFEDDDDEEEGDDEGGLDIDLDLSLSVSDSDGDGDTDLDLGLGLEVTAEDSEGNSASIGASASVNVNEDGGDVDADAHGDAQFEDEDGNGFVGSFDLGLSGSASEDGFDGDVASHGNTLWTNGEHEIGGHWAIDGSAHADENGASFDADGDGAVGFADGDSSTTVEVGGSASGEASEDGAAIDANADASAEHRDDDGHSWAVDAALDAAARADEDGASLDADAVAHWKDEDHEGAFAVSLSGWYGEDRVELRIITFGSVRVGGGDSDTNDFVIDFNVAKWFEDVDMDGLEHDDDGVIRIDFVHNGEAYDDIVDNLIDAITFKGHSDE